MTTLFARLTIAFTGILLILGLSVLWLTHRSSQNYFLEFTQQLNAPIAMYMAENGGFVENDALNPSWLEDLAPHVMMINPSVEVYMLDRTGSVIASSPENRQLALETVGLEAIDAFLKDDRALPIKGDNPNHPTDKQIFSAFPLHVENTSTGDREVAGYVYAVVAGKHYQSMLDSLKSSYSFRTLALTLLSVLLLAFLSGVMVFMMLTRRLKLLNNRVLQNSRFLPAIANEKDQAGRRVSYDEIDQLAHSYQSMAGKLVAQYEELERKDSNRREFIANISHDLRTPLTTMQSYLETLLLKNKSLSSEEKYAYTRIAFRQSKHLRKLVAQLFTLTKLESGEIDPAIEIFSLLELANDTAQEFQIKAQRHGVNLYIEPVSSQGNDFNVQADIGMIHRVFENLVGNAIRHTSKGGNVYISLERGHSDFVDVSFVDSGCGMSRVQCEQVMQRYYTGAGTQAEGISAQSGLGLAIVNNILALHDASMTIESEPGIGTTIRFRIASATPVVANIKCSQKMEKMVS